MSILYDYAMSFVGTRYKWGGLSPMEGLDCSSFVRLLLKSQGVVLPSLSNSQGLFEHFRKIENHVSEDPQLGALVFYGATISSIDHVTMCLNEDLQIECAGGNHTTLSLQDAIDHKAFVRVSPIRYGDKFRACFLPKFPFS